MIFLWSEIIEELSRWKMAGKVLSDIFGSNCAILSSTDMGWRVDIFTKNVQLPLQGQTKPYSKVSYNKFAICFLISSLSHHLQGLYIQKVGFRRISEASTAAINTACFL